MGLVMALNQAFSQQAAQQGIAAQTGGATTGQPTPGSLQAFNGYGLAIIDEVRRLAIILYKIIDVQFLFPTMVMVLSYNLLTPYLYYLFLQISRMDTAKAGPAIYWGLSGAGGPQLAQQVVTHLDTLQAHIGCSDPLRTALRGKS